MNLRALTAALLLITAGPAAQAASLALIPSASTVVQNGAFTVNLVLNAADAPGTHPGLFSGEIVVNFDKTRLTYNGFTLASGLSFYVSPVVVTNGNTQTVRLGFEKAADIGTVGTFAFTAIGNIGSLATIGLIDADDFAGSFVNTVPTNQRFYPALTGAQMSVVPLPAGVWLLGTAVGALVVRRQLRHTAA